MKNPDLPQGIFYETGRYRARIWAGYIGVDLGRYVTLDEALAARKLGTKMRKQGRTAAEIRDAFKTAGTGSTAEQLALHELQRTKDVLNTLNPATNPHAMQHVIQLYQYNPETGVIARAPNAPAWLFPTTKAWRRWTNDAKHRPSDVTQTRNNIEQRRFVRPIQNLRICATRVAWALATGDLITQNFTYRDGDPSNLKLENIAPALDTD